MKWLTSPRVSLSGIPQALVMLLSAIGGNAIAQQNDSDQPAKPFLLVEGWIDRNYVSDLYAFEMTGKLVKRLTSEPLPTNNLAAVSPGLGDPYFVANASAVYGLSLRHNMLMAVHAADVLVLAISPDGRTAAFVTTSESLPASESGTSSDRRGGERSGPPLILRVRPVIAGSPWRAMQLPLPAGIVPCEMTFTPDGEHVLITHWVDGRIAQLLLVELTTGNARTVLAADGLSFHGPAFAPDGKSLLVVREDFTAGQWAIVSVDWPIEEAPDVIVTAPRGVALSTPIFLADGQRFLFQQNDALARASLDGKTVDTLFGRLAHEDREWYPGLVHRARPARASWIPQIVTRYFARVEWREREAPTADPTADVVVIDVQTSQSTTIALPSSKIRKAVVVE